MCILASNLPPELLTAVFENLSYFDLLRASSTCRYWRGIVLDVAALHRNIFKTSSGSDGQGELYLYFRHDYIVIRPIEDVCEKPCSGTHVLEEGPHIQARETLFEIYYV